MRVIVTVPQGDGWLHKGVSSVTNKLLMDRRYSVEITYPTERPYENNLHHIVSGLRNREDWSFWLNIDADNPPLRNPLDLVELDCDIVGLPTPVYHHTGQGEFPVYLNVYTWDEGANGYRAYPEGDGLVEVDCVGTGCFLMAKRVLDKMSGPIFQRTYYEDGTVEFGNDLAFCKRAREAGVKIHAHFGYQCDHFSERSLRDVAVAIRGMSHG